LSFIHISSGRRRGCTSDAIFSIDSFDWSAGTEEVGVAVN